VKTQKKQAMSVRGAAFLGVGAMVGAGIFALLGEAGAVAGSAVWVSFLLGGVVAVLLGYVVAKLGATYPSGGGLITYLIKGYGPGHVSAVVSWLLYFAALIVTSMVALSFGNYGAALVTNGEGSTAWSRIFTSILIVAVAALNIRGALAIDRIQSTIVLVLLAVFAVFVVATFSQVDISLLSRATYPPTGTIVSSIALTFFAYLGFAVVSYTAGDLPEPRRSLPRAMALALGITTLLYVLISIGVFGTLTVDEVIAHGDTALAEAARPVLGNAGYAMMAIAALLATSSSVNANIYGAVGSTKELADTGLFPPIFGRPGTFGSTRGLGISAAVVLVLANLVDLSSIASLGSVVALVIFLMVAVAGLRLRAVAGINLAVVLTAILSTLVVLVVFVITTWVEDPRLFVAMLAVLTLAIAIEVVWSIRRHRRGDAGAAR
jgi:amino acid transporter